MKILLSGCSITASPKIVQNGVWIPDGFALGECIDGDVEILSRDGAGNKFITRSLLYRLSELKDTPLKVIYQITIGSRYDFYYNHLEDEMNQFEEYTTEKTIPNFVPYQNGLPKDYHNHDKYYTLRTTSEIPNIVLNDVEKNYVKYMYSNAESAISQIEYILMIQNYCDLNSIPVKFIEYQRESMWNQQEFQDYKNLINFDYFVDEPIMDYIVRNGIDKLEWTKDGGHPEGWVHKKFYEDKLKEWVLS
tara:strand:+ start:375 stop:1118 length:744 start_codon:yes stop_codon:yes gene_type:complete